MANWLKKLRIDNTTRNVGEWTVQSFGSWIYAKHNPTNYVYATYRKQIETSTGITTASGSMYTTSSNLTVGFPVTFSTVKNVSVTVQHASYPVWSAVRVVRSNEVEFCMMSSASRSANTSYYIMVTCEGYVA